jgi:hypothetical protein
MADFRITSLEADRPGSTHPGASPSPRSLSIAPRHRRTRGDARPCCRSLLHHQGAGTRYRPWPVNRTPWERLPDLRPVPTSLHQVPTPLTVGHAAALGTATTAVQAVRRGATTADASWPRTKPACPDVAPTCPASCKNTWPPRARRTSEADHPGTRVAEVRPALSRFVRRPSPSISTETSSPPFNHCGSF